MSLSCTYERRLYKVGYNSVAGLDEAGRGSWAGPLVAGAVILNPKIKLDGLNDSKLLTPLRREKLFIKITQNCLAWSVGIISPLEIDELGVGLANRLVFLHALKKLKIRPDYLLVDGLAAFPYHTPAEFIIRGDQKIASIAAASIIAKVFRDNLLTALHQFYPEYNFSKHKGYGTREHRDNLHKFGASFIHRMSYKPIINL